MSWLPAGAVKLFSPEVGQEHHHRRFPSLLGVHFNCLIILQIVQAQHHCNSFTDSLLDFEAAS